MPHFDVILDQFLTQTLGYVKSMCQSNFCRLLAGICTPKWKYSNEVKESWIDKWWKRKYNIIHCCGLPVALNVILELTNYDNITQPQTRWAIYKQSKWVLLVKFAFFKCLIVEYILWEKIEKKFFSMKQGSISQKCMFYVEFRMYFIFITRVSINMSTLTTGFRVRNMTTCRWN